MTFLAHRDPRPLTISAPSGIRPLALFLGSGAMALEVALLSANGEPARPSLRELLKERVGRRATPVLVVVLWGDNRGAVCGPTPDDPVVLTDADRSQLERICEVGLQAPDRHAAVRFVRAAFDQLESPIPGLRNSGLFALHELEVGVRGRRDWRDVVDKAAPLLKARGRELVERLGFSIERLPGPAAVLVAHGTKVAVAVFLERPDQIEPISPLYDGSSPISYALFKADQENLDYVVVSAGSSLRVYPVKPGVGVGRRGRTETYVELNLDLLARADAGYLWLFCSADALKPNGVFLEILAKSSDYAADLGVRLRERIYREVVPTLARAMWSARALRSATAERLQETYEMTLLVLFRLLFVAYAEDKELLPLRTNSAYRAHSLKEIAKRLGDALAGGTAFGDESFYWTEVGQVWKAVAAGNPGWGVPDYDGGLFSSDEEASPAARALRDVALPDRTFAPALGRLLVDETAEGVLGPVDFRSLGVGEFGTIYEGLLESELSVADVDLAVDSESNAFVPARGGAPVEVRAGEVYLHDVAGTRKATGSYYTKPFAVDHLLDHALEPALTEHLARLDAHYDAREAAEHFFRFYIADIAMGSGHFLVAAIDRIERRLSNYLAKRPLPGVRDELERLRQTALEKLGPDWAGDSIEDMQLLRRQIARRCVCGVDLNPLAVELARLSIWIHTFVPGLPLSFLDGNLVVGNSLVGIATFAEASELLGVASGDLFSFTAAERLKRAKEPLERLSRLAEATAAEVREARKLYDQARARIRDEEVLLTVLTASRVDETIEEAIAEGRVATRLEAQGSVFSDVLISRAEQALQGLRPLHFPIAFPHVFLGDRRGFDVIIGNPPWEEATVEEDAFWARHFPGLRSLPQREQEARKAHLRRERPDLAASFQEASERAARMRDVLTSGPYPGMGTGDPDVYKAFCWRFWNLVSPEGGRIGVVLPRAALAAKGSTEFRLTVFEQSKRVDVTMLLNNRKWVFEEVHPQYTIALVSVQRDGAENPLVALRGPYPSLPAYKAGVVKEPSVFYGRDVVTWNDTASLPLLPTDMSVDVFAKLRRAPRLELDDGASWRARPYAELHATNDKKYMDLKSEKCPTGFWPVYKGESFDLWNPDTGTYYAWADPRKVLSMLQDKRKRGSRTPKSPFSEFPATWLGDEDTLPCLTPRIALRDITNRTNQRTVIAAMVPPKVFLTNAAPYVLWPRGRPVDQAFLLGVLSSIPLDWYARRFVETHVNFFILNSFPIPRPPDEHPLRLRIVDTVARLVCHDDRFRDWGRALRVKARRLAEEERADLVMELDATVAHLYGLEEGELVHIFETFHEGWDYHQRLANTLRHFKSLKSLK